MRDFRMRAPFFRNAYIALLIFVLGGMMSACTTDSWIEEVLLGNGEVIVIERSLIQEGGGGEIVLNPSGRKPKQHVIRYRNNLMNLIVEWSSSKTDYRNYPETPLIFDIDSGVPTVFTIIPIETGCSTYVKYVFKNGVWLEEALPERFQKRVSNLGFTAGSGVVDLLTKEKKNNKPGFMKSFYFVGPNKKAC